MNIVRLVDEAVSIYDVAAHYRLPWGEDTGRPQQVHCPMHADYTPSARVYSASGGGYCWTCQAFFGPVRLAATQEEISLTAAAHLLARRYAIDLTPDADMATFRELAARWEAGPDSDTPEARRAAALAFRVVDMDWASARAFLPLYDALDAHLLKPLDWVDLARTATATATDGVE